jgi:polyisoprenoid-binding protein YceI
MDGADVPAAGTWVTDPAHTIAGFSARHLMVTRVRGRFDEVRGEIEVGQAVEDSKVRVRIGAESITTSQPQRDEHLRSPDFLDVERFPDLIFESTGIERVGQRELRIRGDLTIRDVTPIPHNGCRPPKRRRV